MFKFTKDKSDPREEHKESLLDNADNLDQDISPVQIEDSVAIKENDSKKYACCSWKCCCLTTTLTLTLIIVILFLYLFLSVAPQFAQSTLDHASMDVINGSIYSPTEDTITMDTTVLVSNAGMVNGELSSHTATVSVDGIDMGTMPMPILNTIANENVIISLSAVLSITNKTHFQKTCKALLQNIDQTWHLSGRNVKLTVDTGLMKTDFTVNVEKDLVLKAAKLYHFIASDMNVNTATDSTIQSVSNLEFISDSIFEFNLPNTLMNVYYDNVYIGYAPLHSLSMKPGLNTILNQSIMIEKTDNNQYKLNEFFSNYLHGTDQEVLMKGPIPSASKGYSSVVIDGVFEQTVTSLGYKKGDLAFGGLLTSATQQGWTVDGETIRGAYSNFINPLNVPVQITAVQALATMPETLEYHVSLIKYVPLVQRNCVAKEFGSMRIGRGIYSYDHDKTWVDVEANARVTYFAIVDPPDGQFEGNCLDKFPFDCCYATLTAAYACSLNSHIQNNPGSGQLDIDYMPLMLEANVTILVNNEFEIVTATSQPFLPLYFGKEVYNGYIQDLGLSCEQFTFKR